MFAHVLITLELSKFFALSHRCVFKCISACVFADFAGFFVRVREAAVSEIIVLLVFAGL